MKNRNRNTAIMLVGAGLFLLLGNVIGFFTVTAFIIIWLAIYKLRHTADKTGYVLLAVGIIMLLSHHLTLIIAIILISLGYYFMKSRQLHKDDAYMQKQTILESLKWNKDPWILKNLSIWSIIGEINMDMSIAMAEKGETIIVLQGVVGDIDIIVPEDLGVTISASVLLGQINVMNDKEAGLLNKRVWQSANYESMDNKVNIVISYIVGDVDIKPL